MIIIFCDYSFMHAVGIINANGKCDYFGRKQYQIFGDKNIHDIGDSNIYTTLTRETMMKYGKDDSCRTFSLIQKYK